VISRQSGTVVAYIFERRIEEMLAPSGCTTPDFRRELHSAVRSEMSHLPPTAQIPVLLTCSSARARLRDALFPEYPRLRVVSYDELDPDINVQPVARISLL
jgi:type III secretion protein V